MLAISHISFVQPNYKVSKPKQKAPSFQSKDIILSDKSFKILEDICEKSKASYNAIPATESNAVGIQPLKTIVSKFDEKTQTLARIQTRTFETLRINLDNFVSNIRMKFNVCMQDSIGNNGEIADPKGKIKNFSWTKNSKPMEYNESKIDNIISEFFGTK